MPDRPSPTNRRFTSWLLPVAVGVAIGVLGFTWWLLVLLVLTIALGGVLGARDHVATSMAAPDGSVQCPRCEAAPRTASGWCGPCTALLRQSPVPAGHPVHAYAAAAVARDMARLVQLVADPHTVQGPQGRRSRMSRKAFRRSAGFGLLLFRNAASSVVAMYAEPQEPDSVWLHTRDTGKGALGFGSVDIQLICKHRFEHGLVTESIYAPALPKRQLSGLVG